MTTSKRVSLSGAVVWLLPLSFIVHDGEEILTMPGWIARNGALLQELAAGSAVVRRVVHNLPVSGAAVAVAVAFELLLILIATWWLARRPKSFGLYFYAAILGGYALHVLTHLGQALWFGGYTPGVVTALVVIPPAAFVIYKRLFTQRLISLQSALVCTLAGAGLLLPVVVTAHAIGRLLGS